MRRSPAVAWAGERIDASADDRPRWPPRHQTQRAVRRTKPAADRDSAEAWTDGKIRKSRPQPPPSASEHKAARCRSALSGSPTTACARLSQHGGGPRSPLDPAAARSRLAPAAPRVPGGGLRASPSREFIRPALSPGSRPARPAPYRPALARRTISSSRSPLLLPITRRGLLPPCFPFIHPTPRFQLGTGRQQGGNRC